MIGTKILKPLREGEKHLPKITRLSSWIIPCLLPLCYFLTISFPLEQEFFSISHSGEKSRIMVSFPLWLPVVSVLSLMLFQAHSIKWAFAFFVFFFCALFIPPLREIIPLTEVSLLKVFFESSILLIPQILIFSGLFTLVGFTTFFTLRWLLSFLLFHLMKKQNFKLSSTEKEALLTGTSWIERGFFSGHPDFKTLKHLKLPSLTEEEKNFLDKETGELCKLSKEWDLIQKRELSKPAESFLEKKKFFGLIIPQSYKGLGFSPFAHAKVIEKLAGHNIPLSIITAVPNSLGPAELLLKYGTDEQKNQYLPRLAVGEEWPCFGLTEVQAGSDASSIQSEGLLFKENGVLKIKLNFSKRWITLSSKASLIGLALRLKDPDHLYSKKTDLGISCLLVPADSPGVKRGRLHDPMGCPIYNAPIEGENVIVTAEGSIIGGMKNAGRGWPMLTETLSMGRGITLPSLAVGSSKRIAYLTGAHAFVRRQFGLPIGKFEGVKEALSEIAGLSHLMESTQSLTLKGLLQGKTSSALSALTKYHLTEMALKVAKKGMDVMGGLGLSLGPKNKIASVWTFLPLSITVEGANILTRSLIIYGQGITKAHLYGYPLIQSFEQGSVRLFHQNFWKWIYQGLCNGLRALVFSLSRGVLIFPPLFLFKKRGRAVQKLAWTAGLFSFLSDLNLLLFGGRLKIKESLSGRMADILSFQYMAFALIWRYREEGHSTNTWLKTKLSFPRKRESRSPDKHSTDSWLKTKWGLDFCFSKIQESLIALLENYPRPLARLFLKPLLLILKINPIGRPPSDPISHRLASKLLTDEAFRKKLCQGIHIPSDPEDQFYRLNRAFQLSLKEMPILKKIKSGGNIEMAFKKNLITKEEYEILQSAKKARWEALQADSQPKEEYFKTL